MEYGLYLTWQTGVRCEAENLRGEGMGPQGPEAHLLWYAFGYLPRSSNFAFHSILTSSTIGKILKDDDTVETYKIEEKGFVVCMVNKVWRESH